MARSNVRLSRTTVRAEQCSNLAQGILLRAAQPGLPWTNPKLPESSLNTSRLDATNRLEHVVACRQKGHDLFGCGQYGAGRYVGTNWWFCLWFPLKVYQLKEKEPISCQCDDCLQNEGRASHGKARLFELTFLVLVSRAKGTQG